MERPGDDDVRALLQGRYDGTGSDVDVGALDPLPDGGEGLARLHVGQGVAALHELVQPLQDVVTGDQADPGLPSHARAPARVHQRLGAPPGVHPPGVGDDAHPLLHAGGEDALHEGHEVTGVAGRGVPPPLLLHDGHGDLGQVVHHEVVQRTPLHLPHGGLQVVAPEALAGADPQDVLVCHQTTPSGSWKAPRWGPSLWSAARSSSDSAGRTSSGRTTSSTKPRAAAKRASS